MDTINYFIAPGDLSQQSDGDSYGPVGTTQFQVTSVFNGGTNPVAYAVCTGVVFIVDQSDNADRINLFLKPNLVQFGAPIKYFIYRGLLKGDFLDAGNSYNGIRPPASDDSMFIQNLRKGQNTSQALNLYSDLTDDYFIDDLFFSDQYQFAPVNQGDSIGRYDSLLAYGFEIMLNETFFAPTLGTARLDENIIDVSGEDDIEVAKLEILNYIDPAAYYGLFTQSAYSVGTNIQSPTSHSTDDIYSFISKFNTKNAVYFDIRDQNNWPIDWFEDSPQTIKLTTDGTPAFSSAEIPYRESNQFPIGILRNGFSNAQSTSEGQNYFQLNLSLSTQIDPETPLLTLLTGYWLKFAAQLEENMIFSVCNDNSGWTDDKKFTIYGIEDSGNTSPIASYIRLEYGSYNDISALNNQVPADDDDDNSDNADNSGDGNDEDSTDFYINGLFPFQTEGIPDYQTPLT